MEDLKKQAEQQLEQLNRLIAKAEKRLKAAKDVRIRSISTSKRQNGYHYYFFTSTGKRIYVRKQDLDAVRRSVQKHYDTTVLKALTSNRNCLQKFLDHYDPGRISDAYDKLCDARKALIDPVYTPDEQYIQEWLDSMGGSMNTYPMQTTYQTDNGEFVRSKSEKILADLFLKHGIPYRYEPELKLSDGSTMYPDFALLLVKQRRMIYWEHFGLVSDSEYAKKTMKKMWLYEKNKLEIGKDILFSMESEDMPLDIKHLEKKIRGLLA